MNIRASLKDTTNPGQFEPQLNRFPELFRNSSFNRIHLYSTVKQFMPQIDSSSFTQILRQIRSACSRVMLIPTLVVLLLLQGCGQDDDQQQFEQEAFQLPEGITETENGTPQNEDPDDWRTSPFFSGLVEVTPAYPNPVLTTEQLTIDVNISGIDAVSTITVAVLIADGSNSQLRPLNSITENPVPPGLSTLRINPVQLGRFNTAESARGLHRIILYDNRDNIISYGDVRVE